MHKVLLILISPVIFLITLPIEVPLWREFRKQGYNVPGYLRFFWYRCILLKEQNYKKVTHVQK